MSHNPIKQDSGAPAFQRRGNTLNLKQLREDALAARYGKYSIEPQLLMQLIEQVEKSDPTRYNQLESLTRELINHVGDRDEAAGERFQKKLDAIA